MSKSIFVGTGLDKDEHRQFSVRAAESGLSRSALLKKITLEFLAKSKVVTAKPARKGVKAA